MPASSGLSYSYDDLNRRTLRRIAGQNVTTQVETYSYYSPGQYVATNLVNKITYADNSTLSYTYNSNNNIIAVTDGNGKRISYKYDGMGQLIRENNPYTNLTTVYSYDKGGNITSAKEYAYTTAAELCTVKKTNTYTYGDSNWKDKLTAYNGKTITYDKIGNPLTYRDSLSFTWKNGRQLASLQNGSSVINYTYNADGVRIGKSGSRAGTFIVSGTQILREINSVATIDYLYDENGSPIGLTYKGKTYYYRKNLQGDIINITDSTGAKVVTYTYNAWGKLMSMTGNMELAVNNPFRYRGYYYDVESGFYYLNSRYYDPQTGRFINADSLLGTDGFASYYNLFTYCGNNCVSNYDCNGDFSTTVYFLNNDNMGDLSILCNQASENSKNNNLYNKISSGYDFANFSSCFFPSIKLFTVAVENAISSIKYVIDQFPKYSDELDKISLNIGDIRMKYKNSKYKFKLTLLFGSHNNQLQVQVYKVSWRRIKNKKGKYTLRRQSITVNTYNYELLFNGSIFEIENSLKN